MNPTANPAVSTVADAETALGPELTARAYALSDGEPCQPAPEQIERLRRIFTREHPDTARVA